jgi:Uma2 family endonuclease
LTPEEYLALERRAEYKSEYFDGAVYAISGASLKHNTIVANVIIEVLSESTAAFDRGDKFQAYQQMESLKEYLLISQDKNVIEQYVRQTREIWNYTATVGLESSLSLLSIECTLRLEAVYDKTE